MKSWCALFFLTFIFTGFSQKQFEGRYRLDKVIFKGGEYFNRKAGPPEDKSTITVTWATPDEAFNESMNKKPYDYFSNSQFTFLEDSVFVRVGTSAQGGQYRNEYQYGKFKVYKDTNLIDFMQAGKPPLINQFSYVFDDDSTVTLTSNNGLIATYVRHPNKIDNEFKETWKNSDAAIFIDAYYQNEISWEELHKDPKLAGMIHKAGQGLMVDQMYDARKFECQRRNLLWGSYWLGTSDDPIEQADLYYKISKGDSTELHCLDLEDVNAKDKMNLKQAEKFINRWYELTGRYPAIYCNKNVLEQIEKKYNKKSVFAKCPLWYASFRKDIPDFDSNIWDTYTLWQFSSEINCEKTGDCLYNVPGTEYDMDVNVFNGSITEARAIWPNL